MHVLEHPKFLVIQETPRNNYLFGFINIKPEICDIIMPCSTFASKVYHGGMEYPLLSGEIWWYQVFGVIFCLPIWFPGAKGPKVQGLCFTEVCHWPVALTFAGALQTLRIAMLYGTLCCVPWQHNFSIVSRDPRNSQCILKFPLKLINSLSVSSISECAQHNCFSARSC